MKSILVQDQVNMFGESRVSMGHQSDRSDDHVINLMLFQIRHQLSQRVVESSFAHEIALSLSVDLSNGTRFSAHKYSSTFRTISRIWNGRPFTLEKGTASIRYRARIIVHS